MALHALSRYGAATFPKTQKTVQVTIRDSQTFSTKFQVDSSNLLLLQQVSLPELPGEYVITVTGERCVYLQVRLWSYTEKKSTLILPTEKEALFSASWASKGQIRKS